jgi:hypothetical protein
MSRSVGTVMFLSLTTFGGIIFDMQHLHLDNMWVYVLLTPLIDILLQTRRCFKKSRYNIYKIGRLMRAFKNWLIAFYFSWIQFVAKKFNILSYFLLEIRQMKFKDSRYRDIVTYFHYTDLWPNYIIIYEAWN